MDCLFHCRRRPRELALVLPPAAEHRQSIEQSAVICPAAAMLFEEASNFVGIEEAGIGGTG
jgi:hypothetical protein